MESVASDIFLNIIEKTASGVGVSILDGNIKLDSTVEIPLLHGGFNYYPNKAEQDKSDSIRMESLQILFI